MSFNCSANSDIVRYSLTDSDYKAQVTARAWEHFCIAKEEFMRKQAIRGEPTPLSGLEATERTETEHGEDSEQADREGAGKDYGRKKVETERLERERLERERLVRERLERKKLESERVERELADREWEEQERTQREWDENEPAPIELDEEDEVMPHQTIVIDSDSSDVPSCSRTGAAS